MPITTITGELYLNGDVGDLGYPEFFTAKEVAQALSTLPRNRTAKVRLNSGGGFATEGSAVAAAFRTHAPGVEVCIEGIAASAATVAACGAGRCTIGFGSLYMVHEASGLTVGPADMHRKNAAELDVMNATMAGVYAAKTKRLAGEMRELMRAETWMTAEEAVTRGFCDAVVGLPSDHPAYAWHDYRQYRHAPSAVLHRARRGGMASGAPAQAERDRGAAIARACNEAGRPEMMAELIAAPISAGEASRRVHAAASLATARERGKALMRAECERQGLSKGQAQPTAAAPPAGPVNGKAIMADMLRRQGIEPRT